VTATFDNRVVRVHMRTDELHNSLIMSLLCERGFYRHWCGAKIENDDIDSYEERSITLPSVVCRATKPHERGVARENQYEWRVWRCKPSPAPPRSFVPNRAATKN